MRRSSLELSDILHAQGAAYRQAHAGRLSLGQLKVMAAIEQCRTAALGGHVAACHDCGHTRIAYNSCRNRHCPGCQGAAAHAWLAARQADLLPRPDEKPPNSEPPFASPPPCPHCGGIMAVIETFLPGTQPRAPPSGHVIVAIAS